MGPKDYIIIAVIAVVVGLAVWYIYRAKRKGQKCIGCPYSCSCGSKNNCSNHKKS